MPENKDIQDENLELQEETTVENPIESTENLSATPSMEEILAEEKNRYIRLFAEFENYKKRTAKERNEFFQFANQDMMVSMLAILDDFERALKEIAKSGSEDDLKGVELIYQKFKGKLVEKGLQMIEVKSGDNFDVDFHEAITQTPTPQEELKGKIVDVIEVGYTLHGKVIRFTKVVTGF